MAKKTITIDKTYLQEAYIKYCLTEEKAPSSAFKLASFASCTEVEFYQHYNSIKSIAKDIPLTWYHKVNELLLQDENYPNYNGREKLLAFYFSLFELLKQNRSYLLYLQENTNSLIPVPSDFERFKDSFSNYIEDLLSSAKLADEIEQIKFLDKAYSAGFWAQFVFVYRFWLKDDSENFEQTDAAIEKAVNLSFELLKKGPLDAVVDFSKFLIQHKSKLSF